MVICHLKHYRDYKNLELLDISWVRISYYSSETIKVILIQLLDYKLWAMVELIIVINWLVMHIEKLGTKFWVFEVESDVKVVSSTLIPFRLKVEVFSRTSLLEEDQNYPEEICKDLIVSAYDR